MEAANTSATSCARSAQCGRSSPLVRQAARRLYTMAPPKLGHRQHHLSIFVWQLHRTPYHLCFKWICLFFMCLQFWKNSRVRTLQSQICVTFKGQPTIIERVMTYVLTYLQPSRKKKEVSQQLSALQKLHVP